MITNSTIHILNDISAICPACQQRPVRCRGLCKSCRRQVQMGMMPETCLAPRRRPGRHPKEYPALTLRGIG